MASYEPLFNLSKTTQRALWAWEDRRGKRLAKEAQVALRRRLNALRANLEPDDYYNAALPLIEEVVGEHLRRIPRFDRWSQRPLFKALELEYKSQIGKASLTEGMKQQEEAARARTSTMMQHWYLIPTEERTAERMGELLGETRLKDAATHYPTLLADVMLALQDNDDANSNRATLANALDRSLPRLKTAATFEEAVGQFYDELPAIRESLVSIDGADAMLRALEVTTIGQLADHYDTSPDEVKRLANLAPEQALSALVTYDTEQRLEAFPANEQIPLGERYLAQAQSLRDSVGLAAATLFSGKVGQEFSEGLRELSEGAPLEDADEFGEKADKLIAENLAKFDGFKGAVPEEALERLHSGFKEQIARTALDRAAQYREDVITKTVEEAVRLVADGSMTPTQGWETLEAGAGDAITEVNKGQLQRQFNRLAQSHYVKMLGREAGQDPIGALGSGPTVRVGDLPAASGMTKRRGGFVQFLRTYGVDPARGRLAPYDEEAVAEFELEGDEVLLPANQDRLLLRAFESMYRDMTQNDLVADLEAEGRPHKTGQVFEIASKHLPEIASATVDTYTSEGEATVKSVGENDFITFINNGQGTLPSFIGGSDTNEMSLTQAQQEWDGAFEEGLKERDRAGRERTAQELGQINHVARLVARGKASPAALLQELDFSISLSEPEKELATNGALAIAAQRDSRNWLEDAAETGRAVAVTTEEFNRDVTLWLAEQDNRKLRVLLHQDDPANPEERNNVEQQFLNIVSATGGMIPPTVRQQLHSGMRSTQGHVAARAFDLLYKLEPAAFATVAKEFEASAFARKLYRAYRETGQLTAQATDGVNYATLAKVQGVLDPDKAEKTAYDRVVANFAQLWDDEEFSESDGKIVDRFLDDYWGETDETEWRNVDTAALAQDYKAVMFALYAQGQKENWDEYLELADNIVMQTWGKTSFWNYRSDRRNLIKYPPERVVTGNPREKEETLSAFRARIQDIVLAQPKEPDIASYKWSIVPTGERTKTDGTYFIDIRPLDLKNKMQGPVERILDPQTGRSLIIRLVEENEPE